MFILRLSSSWMSFVFVTVTLKLIHRRGVVGRVFTFQIGGTGSIPGEVRNFNISPETGCESIVSFT